MKKKLSIIVPVYCNYESLYRLYDELYSKVFPFLNEYELVMVDDGSTDKSWELMNELASKHPNIKLIKLSRNFGSHAAILAGLNECTGDCAVVKAADCQEPASLIMDMYHKWQEGYKVVLAERTGRHDGKATNASAHQYYSLVRKFALKNMPENGFDVYLVDRQVIEALRNMDEKNSALTLQVLWAGYDTAIVGYERKAREEGKSKWTLAKKVKLAIDSIVSFSFAPIRAITYTGLLVFAVSIIWAFIVLINHFAGQIQVAGYTTLSIIILLSTGLIMLTLGILGEYIWRAMDNSRNRPVYLIDRKAESPFQYDSEGSIANDKTI